MSAVIFNRRYTSQMSGTAIIFFIIVKINLEKFGGRVGVTDYITYAARNLILGNG